MQAVYPQETHQGKYLITSARLLINNAYVLGNNNGVDLYQGYTAAHNIGPVFFGANRSETTATDTYKLSIYDPIGDPGILDNIPNYSEFYIYTHGNTDVFGDCYAEGSSDDTFYMFGTSGSDPLGDPTVRDRVNAKSLTPPFNFVYVDACYTAKDNSLAEAFLPFTNLAVDRAFLGWTTSVEDDPQNVTFSTNVMQNLANGMTLESAIAAANQASPPFYDDPTTNQRLTALTSVFGDKTMKMRGYYGGTGTDWYLLKP